jgi:CRP/FNR family cyclic AMP-dependent transcriptional regulator
LISIIVKGKVKVSLVNPEGREVVLDILEKGDFFGELSFLDNRFRSAMVTAMTDVRLMFIERDSFRTIVRENSDIAVNLLSVMASRLRKSNEMIETLAFLDVAGRVAKLLIEMAGESGEEMPHSFLRIRALKHQTIANRIGASREAVTKAMKSLAANGLVAMDGKDMVISPRQF